MEESLVANVSRHSKKTYKKHNSKTDSWMGLFFFLGGTTPLTAPPPT